MYTENPAKFYDIISNNSGFGIYNSSTAKMNLHIEHSGRLNIIGEESGGPSLLLKNDNYNSTNTSGTASLQFAFADHYGPKIEAYKIGNNLTALKLYTEYGFNQPQLGMTLMPTSNGTIVGIGTESYNPNYKLSVDGKIRAREVKVEAANWPDYVFDRDYKMPSLSAIEEYISLNKRLPEMPSAAEATTNGIELGEMNKLLLKKN